MYKYRFITVVHNLKLESIKNKGSQIFPGARLSNGTPILNETLNTGLISNTLGFHSINEFYDESSYIYINGKFSDLKSKEEVVKIGSRYTFYLLREVQSFVHKLWEIKDNSVYIRDGFLIVYKNNIEDGLTFKGSLSEIFTFSTGEINALTYSDEEIFLASSRFSQSEFDDYSKESFGGKIPDSKHLFKVYGSQRFVRAFYFISVARKSAIPPMKIISYCMALESLFTVGKSEINHKIAERVALLLGSSQQSKEDLFQLVKSAYNYKSTLVHGQHLKGEEDKLTNISRQLDEVLRALIIENHSIFSESDQRIEEFFLDLLFKDNI